MQWAMTEHREVLDVWLWILCGCSRINSDSLGWAASDDELLGAAHTLHTSITKINECIKLLERIRYIEVQNGQISVRKWDKLQSEYLKRKERGDYKNVKVYPMVSANIALEERRGDENIYKPNFDSIWEKYPRRVGKKKSQRFFDASVKTPEDMVRIETALSNYKKCKRVADGFIQDGSTWFNNWQDWVEQNGAIPKPKPPREKSYRETIAEAQNANQTS